MDANKDLLSSNAGSKGLVLSEKVKFHIQDPLQMDPVSLEADTTMKEDGFILHGKNLKKPDKLLINHSLQALKPYTRDQQGR